MKIRSGSGLAALFLVFALWSFPSSTTGPTPYVVDTVVDELDGSCADDCSLRDAIVLANAHTGPDAIHFDIPGCSPTCVIHLTLGNLQYLTGGGTTIDGYTQPGAVPVTVSTPANLMIVLDGSSTTLDCGLHITSSGNTIRGLAIGGFEWSGVCLEGSDASSNTIEGSLIAANGEHGVSILDGASDNTIGGDEPAERNVISANGMDGVQISGMSSTGNAISGNYIGTDPTGTLNSWGNTENGVDIRSGAKLSLVGGKGPGMRNVISGNTLCGVAISGTGTTNNTVSANYIGTKAGGTEPLGNVQEGVCIGDGAQSNTIGGDAPGEGNLISGNGTSGVTIHGSGSVNNVVSGNQIGTDAKGVSSLPNTYDGISLTGGARFNTIGGETEGERNVISGNSTSGVSITNGRDNTICGNYIGTDAGGTQPLGNGWYGVFMQSSSRDNTVGGVTAGEGNLISANGMDGIEVRGAGTMGNTVQGNYIGTSVTGHGDLGNTGSGCSIVLDAQYNTVGPGNVIAHNSDGVRVVGSNTYGNIITANRIFSNDDDPIDLSLNGNWNIPWPVIDTITSGPVQISGTSCPRCIVEVFANGQAHRQAETYVGSSTANDSGEWTLTLPHLPKPYLTANATSLISGTSELNGPWDSGIRTLFLPLVARGL